MDGLLGAVTQAHVQSFDEPGRLPQKCRLKAPGSLQQQIEPCHLDLDAVLHHLDHRPWNLRVVDLQHSPIRSPSIDVCETVLARHLPRAEELSGSFEYRRVAGERDQCATYEQRRLRLQEVPILLTALLPILFGNAEISQHALRAHEAWRDCYSHDTMRAQFRRADGCH